VSEARTVRTETLEVRRTARIAMLGPAGPPPPEVRELWYVLHGYGERAAPFLENCRAVDDGLRLIVAPEALSRFYQGDLNALSHRSAPVGASWMTRDEREHEIADYLRYLDDLHATIMARLGGASPAITVLGFSQGGATGARWVASGRVPAERLVLWGSGLAPELDIASPDTPLRRAETVFVVGAADIYITPKIVQKELDRLRAADFPFRLVSFAGGHRLDDATLRALAEGTSPRRSAAGRSAAGRSATR
jgi:predicted esterase